MRAFLKVLSPGLSTRVVDRGRPRTRALGLPVGGAADRVSFALGNLLVGNAPDVPALEVTLFGPTLLADSPIACVLFGAPFDVRTDRRDLHAGTTFTLEPGETLKVGGTPIGARAYLCVLGGFHAPEVLGSRSGLAPLKAGDVLPCSEGKVSRRGIGPSIPVEPAGSVPRIHQVRILPAAQSSWFPSLAGTFRVCPESDRMGLRLAGPPLPGPPREIVSEPVCPGTIQVTRNGQCIILGVDGQSIGGYPKIAQTITADLPRIGQLRPNDFISFVPVSLDEAEAALREQEAMLRRWRVSLETFA